MGEENLNNTSKATAVCEDSKFQEHLKQSEDKIL